MSGNKMIFSTISMVICVFAAQAINGEVLVAAPAAVGVVAPYASSYNAHSVTHSVAAAAPLVAAAPAVVTSARLAAPAHVVSAPVVAHSAPLVAAAAVPSYRASPYSPYYPYPYAAYTTLL